MINIILYVSIKVFAALLAGEIDVAVERPETILYYNTQDPRFMARAHTHTRTHRQTHKCTHAPTWTHANARARALMDAQMHSCLRTHAYSHART